METVLTEQSIEFRLLTNKNKTTVNTFLTKHLINNHKFILSGLTKDERYIIYSSIDKTIKFKKIKNNSISIEKNDGIDTFSESSNDISLQNNHNESEKSDESDESEKNEDDKLINSDYDDDSEFSNSIEINNDTSSINYDYIINEIKKDNKIWFTVILTINIINLFIQLSNYHK